VTGSLLARCHGRNLAGRAFATVSSCSRRKAYPGREVKLACRALRIAGATAGMHPRLSGVAQHRSPAVTLAAVRLQPACNAATVRFLRRLHQG
jgi:hypothetical protein